MLSDLVPFKPVLSDLVPTSVFLGTLLCDLLRRCSYHSSKAVAPPGPFPRESLYFKSPVTQSLFPSAVGAHRQTVESPQWGCVRGEVVSWKAAVWENVWLAGFEPRAFWPPYFDPVFFGHAQCRLMNSLLPPWGSWAENCVEFQKTNDSLNVTSENATSPVIEFWE